MLGGPGSEEQDLRWAVWLMERVSGAECYMAAMSGCRVGGEYSLGGFLLPEVGSWVIGG